MAYQTGRLDENHAKMPRTFKAGWILGVALVSGAALAQSPVGKLTGGKGLAILKSNAGTAYGRVGKGRITIVDPPRGRQTKVSVSNCDEIRHPKARTTVCIGDDITFIVQYGVWTATLRGRGINASAVVRGMLKLRGTRGRFSIDGGQTA